MALRAKTLWYGTKLDADIVDVTVTNLDQFTVYCENASRTFRAALVWVAFQDIITVTGGTIAEHRVALRLGAGAYTTVTELDDIVHSGENIAGVIGPFDFTSVFAADFGAGDSQTCDIQVYFGQSTGTTLNMRNVCALMALTYEFADTAATQYATAIIPLEGSVGGLPTTETELGTNQIPQLTGAGGLLENVASVTVRQQFFLLEGNDNSNGNATDYTLNVRIDTGTTKTFGLTEKGLASDTFKWFLHIEAPVTTTVHAFKAWTTGASRFGPQAVTMFVTYEFAISGTTEFLNSVLIAWNLPSPLGGTTSADASRYQRKFFIPEPATITLKQSGVRLYYYPGTDILGGATNRIFFVVGSQTARQYNDNNSVVCGCGCVQQRIDSGGAQGAGVTIARGENTITIDVYRDDATDLGWSLSGLIVLNYKSGVASAGPAAHTHTTVWKVLDWEAAASLQERVSSSLAPNIPETSYWVTDVGMAGVVWDAVQSNVTFVSAEVKSGEGAGDGWRFLHGFANRRDAELACQWVFGPAADAFDRHPSDPDASRMALETARTYRLANPGFGQSGLVMLVTYHALTWSFSGTVTGYTGDGSGIIVEIHRVDNDQKLYEATTAAGGTYSATVYDNVVSLYGHARQDGTHMGRSDDGVAA